MKTCDRFSPKTLTAHVHKIEAPRMFAVSSVTRYRTIIVTYDHHVYCYDQMQLVYLSQLAKIYQLIMLVWEGGYYLDSDR